MSDAPAMRELLGEDAPTNWGKWGPDDELGALNYLDAKEVLRGVQHIRSGDVFTLQIQMGRTDGPGDPLWPGREGIKRKNELDESTWDGEGAPAFPGGLHYADDTARHLPAGLHAVRRAGPRLVRRQALERLRRPHHRRRDAEGLACCPSRRRASSAAAVLIDMARHRGKDYLDKGETFDHNDLEAAATAQGVRSSPTTS